MEKIIKYFSHKEELILFNKLRTKAYIILSFISFFVLILLIIKSLLLKDDNTNTTIISATTILIFLIIGLFILKNNGIKKAGSISSFGLVVILVIPMHIMHDDISSLYKYLQSFYTILALFSLSVLFASRKILLLNTLIIFISTTRVWLFAIEQNSEFYHFYTTGYVHNSVTLLVISTILYFTIKFGEMAINEANDKAKENAKKNQELASSEEEIRASLEELTATTDALEESYAELEQEKFKADEGNRLKTIFLENISHEIRTPLNGIVGFSDLLNKEAQSNEETKLFTDIIQKSSQKLLKIVDNVLEISKLESKEGRVFNKNFNLNTLLSKIVKEQEEFATTNNNKLIIENFLTENQNYLHTDKDKLFKTISNLTENAIKFTHNGIVKIIIKLNNEKIDFFIEDSGIGINERKSLNIFDKFVQADESISSNFGGLGVGLTIAKHNIELLGGNIFLKSTESKGSVFYFSLNYVAATEKKEKIILDRIDINKIYKVLIVDDKTVNILILSKLISKTKFNCEIFEAQNGQKAIEIAKKHKDIDLILMDKKMPVMTGCEAANKIREFLPKINVVMQSAYTDDDERAKAFEAGCKEFISKPIKKSDLENVFAKYLI